MSLAGQRPTNCNLTVPKKASYSMQRLAEKNYYIRCDYSVLHCRTAFCGYKHGLMYYSILWLCAKKLLKCILVEQVKYGQGK